MYVPIGDNRYFTSGTDNKILQDITLYDPEVYEQAYPELFRTMPEIFSVNMKEELDQFIAKTPPHFEVLAEQVIELACYYYCDWDSVVAVTDELLTSEVMHVVRQNLMRSEYDLKTAEELLLDLTTMLSEAVTRLIGIVIGVLSRVGAPAIMDYGCCYQLHDVDNYGNVYFRLRNPTQVYSMLEGSEVIQRQHCGHFKE